MLSNVNIYQFEIDEVKVKKESDDYEIIKY